MYNLIWMRYVQVLLLVSMDAQALALLPYYLRHLGRFT